MHQVKPKYSKSYSIRIICIPIRLFLVQLSFLIELSYSSRVLDSCIFVKRFVTLLVCGSLRPRLIVQTGGQSTCFIGHCPLNFKDRRWQKNEDKHFAKFLLFSVKLTHSTKYVGQKIIRVSKMANMANWQ
jgi:hypothetical protein